jgi:predicted RNA-binding Zn-ribbon protein involved in translation (DUF1610 family)
MLKKTSNYQNKNSRNEIEVKCPTCGHITVLKDLMAWSYIILKQYLCPNCKRNQK